MYRWSRIIIVTYIVGLLSCKKDSACFHASGDEAATPVRYDLDDFHSLVLDGNIHVVLHPDTANFMEVRGSENDISHIEYVLKGEKLTLYNRNKCNWIRSYKHEMQVTLHFNNMHEVTNLDNGRISCVDYLKVDTFSIYQNGTGDIAMQFDSAHHIWVNTYVIGDVYIYGQSRSMIATVGSYGHLWAETCKVDWIKVETIHEGDAHVYPVNALKATCTQMGDIYYYHHVENIDITESEEGKVELVTE